MSSSIFLRQQALSKGGANGALQYSSARLLLVGLIHAALVCARPLANSVYLTKEHDHSDVPDEPRSPDDATLWIYLSVAVVLVLLGGAFAGLTIAYVTIVAEEFRLAD